MGLCFDEEFFIDTFQQTSSYLLQNLQIFKNALI